MMPDVPEAYDELLIDYFDLQKGYSILESDLKKAKSELERVQKHEKVLKDQAHEAFQKCAQLRFLASSLASFVSGKDLDRLFRSEIADKDSALYCSIFRNWPKEDEPDEDRKLIRRLYPFLCPYCNGTMVPILAQKDGSIGKCDRCKSGVISFLEDEFTQENLAKMGMKLEKDA